MSEQASALAPESGNLSDLANFLAETPEQEPVDEEEQSETVDESTPESNESGDTEDSQNDEQDVDPENPDDEQPAPVENKITVKVKADDGTEETLELTPEDIAGSYLRQKDYTKKTQELAKRENDAVEFLKSKHESIRQEYLSQAELARAAVIQMAGIKTEDELAQLASSDPAAWVSETQRQRQISNYLNALDQQINGEKHKAETESKQRQAQSLQQQYAHAWDALSKEKIDKPALAKIYGDVNKSYGFSNEELGNVYDPRLVKMMRDATAYQALKANKGNVTKQVSASPKLPQRQANPAKEIDRAMDNKFKSGRAKLNDLAAYLR
jgi:hypothetical protein